MSTPYNEDTEQRLLCCMMFGPDHVQTVVASGVTEGYFYVPLNRAIFRALLFCVTADEPTDPLSCWRAMAGMFSPMAKEVEETDRITMLRLVAISGLEPTWIREASFLRDVIALHRQRLLIKALSSASEKAIKSYQSWDECMENVAPHIEEAQRASEEFSCRSNADMIAEAKHAITDPAHAGIDGPFHSWDMNSKQLRRGEYVILAARPSVGKTSMGLMYVGAALKAKKDAAVFSLEMRGPDLFERIGHQISRSEDPALAVAALDNPEMFKHLHVYEERDHHTMPQIEARCRLLASTCNLGVVMIDYLQLLDFIQSGKDGNREQAVAQGSRSLQRLAKRLPCPLIVISQLNRDSERREDNKPRLSDLRESGAIEQDADVVWMLWRKLPDAGQPIDPDKIEVHMEQVKRRNGPQGVFTRFYFNGPTTLFTPILNA